MKEAAVFLVGLFLSYLVGSIPTAYLVGKFVRGIDIRQHGSGNVGATNAFRVIGKKWGIAVLLFDIFKGFFAVFYLPTWVNGGTLPISVTSLVYGLAAIVGHTWTPWLGFRGGKGVATSLGVLIGLVPTAAGMALLTWLGIFLWKRYVSLASLGMAATFPFWMALFYRRSEFFPLLLLISVGLAAFLFYTHRENIRRLRQGQEKKLF